MGGCKGVLEGVITFRRCDTPQGGVKDVRKVCQVMETCDGYGGDVKVRGEVLQLSERMVMWEV